MNNKNITCSGNAGLNKTKTLNSRRVKNRMMEGRGMKVVITKVIVGN